jgi:hypothetical protein
MQNKIICMAKTRMGYRATGRKDRRVIRRVTRIAARTVEVCQRNGLCFSLRCVQRGCHQL